MAPATSACKPSKVRTATGNSLYQSDGKAVFETGRAGISVDTKKKERVGDFKNNGQKWHEKGQAPKVIVHNFPSLAEGTAIPYGAYDVHRNEGMATCGYGFPAMVNVGMTHDTAGFAVESIGRNCSHARTAEEATRPETGHGSITFRSLATRRNWS
jgi:hypothetical protein